MSNIDLTITFLVIALKNVFLVAFLAIYICIVISFLVAFLTIVLDFFLPVALLVTF